MTQTVEMSHRMWEWCRNTSGGKSAMSVSRRPRSARCSLPRSARSTAAGRVRGRAGVCPGATGREDPTFPCSWRREEPSAPALRARRSCACASKTACSSEAVRKTGGSWGPAGRDAHACGSTPHADHRHTTASRPGDGTGSLAGSCGVEVRAALGGVAGRGVASSAATSERLPMCRSSRCNAEVGTGWLRKMPARTCGARRAAAECGPARVTAVSTAARTAVCHRCRLAHPSESEHRCVRSKTRVWHCFSAAPSGCLSEPEVLPSNRAGKRSQYAWSDSSRPACSATACGDINSPSSFESS